jgi:4-hydroxybenzoate polyprenyltransferase
MEQTSQVNSRRTIEKSYYAYEKCLLTTWIGLFTFLRVSSIFTGITGFFVTFMAYILLGMDPEIQVCFSVFLMTFSVYSLNKLTDMKEDAVNMPERLSFLNGRKKLVLCYSLIAYAISVLLAFLDKPSTLPILFIPLASNVIYSIKLIPGIPRIKDIPVMKNLFVAISWTLVCTLLPAMHLKGAPGISIQILIYFILVKLFINAVVYDIRDVKGDRENGIRTLPVLIGPKKTVGILLMLNTTLLPWLMFAGSRIQLISACLILYGYVYTLYFSVLRSPQLFDFFVDGEWLLVSMVLLTLRGFGFSA